MRRHFLSLASALVATMVLCVQLAAGQTTAAATATATSEPAFARPELSAIRFPDKHIKVDGRDGDWRHAGDALAKCRFQVDSKKTYAAMDGCRGRFEGDKDLHITLHLAHDSDYLYLLADVKDQFLVNTTEDSSPNNGDDLEIFIDANPVESQFGQANNENVRQFMFVPAYADARLTKPLVWPAGKSQGVLAASRLTLDGYVLELAVPKALLPNWKTDPDLAQIGFDGLAGEADAPGVDIQHPALKGALFFLTHERHFRNPRKLARLKLATEDVKLLQMLPEEVVAKHAPIPTAEMAAQELLDRIAAKDAAREAGELLKSSKKPIVRKAALQVLAARPELDAPVDAIATMVAQLAKDKGLDARAAAQYGLMALARRGKMPVDKLYDTCGTSADPQIKLTYAWCCGINGDKAATSKLIAMLKDDNFRVRMMAAWAMGVLKDPAAVEPLTKLAAQDANVDVKLQAQDSLEKLAPAATAPAK